MRNSVSSPRSPGVLRGLERLCSLCMLGPTQELHQGGCLRSRRPPGSAPAAALEMQLSSEQSVTAARLGLQRLDWKILPNALGKLPVDQLP